MFYMTNSISDKNTPKQENPTQRSCKYSPKGRKPMNIYSIDHVIQHRIPYNRDGFPADGQIHIRLLESSEFGDKFGICKIPNPTNIGK